MPYAWKYEAYDLNPDDTEGYNRKVHTVEVTVIADNEAEAQAGVEALVTREHYTLDDITEMSDSLWTVGTGRW